MNTQQDKHYSYIDTSDGLKALLDHIASAKRVALDTEADSFHHYFEKVCLIQLSSAGRNFIIDPLAKLDISPLLEVLANKVLIIHDAGYDLRMMKSTFDFVPQAEIFDTMLAAQLLGYERFGLASMLDHFFDVKLTKKGQKSDWSRRPLQQSQVEYAVEDTRYLEKMAKQLESELKKLKRLTWHTEYCQWVVNSATVEKPEPDEENRWRIKGISKLTPDLLVFIKHIWSWRDHQARSRDIPPFKIMGNDQIIHLAHWARPLEKIDLANYSKLPRNCTGKRLDSLQSHMEKARNTPPENWPQQKKSTRCPSYVTENKDLLAKLRKASAQVAHGLKLPPQLIASKATLTSIAYKKPKTLEEIKTAGPLMNWQANLLQKPILEILEQHI